MTYGPDASSQDHADRDAARHRWRAEHRAVPQHVFYRTSHEQWATGGFAESRTAASERTSSGSTRSWTGSSVPPHYVMLKADDDGVLPSLALPGTPRITPKGLRRYRPCGIPLARQKYRNILLSGGKG
jgi:hypothetical protein